MEYSQQMTPSEATKMHLNKFQRISTLRATLSHHSTIKLEINNRKMSLRKKYVERYLQKHIKLTYGSKKKMKIEIIKYKWMITEILNTQVVEYSQDST